ncbi:transcriptional regulator [Krasilnikovia cinnamomea]|uniref:Transcriptional regulator n=1 Tax=Krasilnikovia cinnamomea TaxID=349313 RepID=A0A4Q7ZFY1_9ACTN|nr:winged helix-turn-helix domain-containing protein [Krasilnikovia cinnamomea]RZU49221.1 transcriptional regulator [Krasilnikovia cinnamomea]
MSVLAVADLHGSARPTPTRGRLGRRRTARLRPLPDNARSVTVTVTIGVGGSPEGERVLAALNDLVAAAGPRADIVVDGTEPLAADTPGAAPFGLAAPARPGVLRLDPRPRAVSRDGAALELSRLEYDLLLFFARNPQQVFSRSQLLAQVWGHTHTTARTVDVHVSRLRTKLGDADLITTVYGVGYRLADEARVQVIAAE